MLGLFSTDFPKLSNYEKIKNGAGLKDEFFPSKVASCFYGLKIALLLYLFFIVSFIANAMSPKARRRIADSNCTSLVDFSWRRCSTESDGDASVDDPENWFTSWKWLLCFRDLTAYDDDKPDNACLDYCKIAGWNDDDGPSYDNDGAYDNDAPWELRFKGSTCHLNIAQMCCKHVATGPLAREAASNPVVLVCFILIVCSVYVFLKRYKDSVLKKYTVKVNVNNLNGDHATLSLPVLATEAQILRAINSCDEGDLKDYGQITAKDNENTIIQPCHNSYYDLTSAEEITVSMKPATEETCLLGRFGVTRV